MERIVAEVNAVDKPSAVETPEDSYLRPHPLAQIFPEPEADDLDALRRSLKDRGVFDTDPVILLDGMVLDGVNRYHTALDLGLKCPTVRWEDLAVSKTTTPREFVIARNLARRHLTPGQKAAIVFQVYGRDVDAMRAEAAERQKKGAPTLPSPDGKVPRHERTTAAKVAAIAGVSESTVGRVERAAKADPAAALDRIAKGEATARAVVKAKATQRETTLGDLRRFFNETFIRDVTPSEAFAAARAKFGGAPDVEAALQEHAMDLVRRNVANVADALLGIHTPGGRRIGDTPCRELR
jgi:hypothetical protein